MARSAVIRSEPAEVIHLPTNRRGRTKEPPKTWQGDDDVLFHRRQIKRGVELENFGRRDHASIWTVRQIITFVARGTTWRPTPTDEVKHLTDELVIHKQGTNETRQVTFAALSYSAVWRIRQ